MAVNRASGPKLRGATKPGFFWQGALIVLPAILLGGAGFYSLRQDRLLAEREASEQGKLIATGLARDVLPKAFAFEQSEQAALERWRELPGRPQDEPLLGLAHKPTGRVACLVDAQVRLLYPPPLLPAPEPQPLDEEDLRPDQRADWILLRGPAGASNDVAAAIGAGDRFLAQAPPDRFAAAACYRLGLLWLKQSEPATARKFLEQVAGQYQGAVAETGYPLKTYAQVQLLKAADRQGGNAGRREELINALCAQAVLTPSPLSQSLLSEMAARATNQQTLAGWLQVVQAHEVARALHSQVSGAALAETTTGVMTFRSGWLRLTPTNDWLATWQATGTNYWLVARPEEQARQVVDQALGGLVLPAYLGVSVELAGRRLGPEAPTGDALADCSASPGRDRGVADIRVSVHLTAPGRLYAQQHKRTLWFGALIAASVAAVLAGFFTAWRAFRRQRQLHELKSNFVSAVSHELRAPIASIRLMSEELEDFAAQDAVRSREYHHLIHQECRRLSWLIGNVLDFARHEQGRQQYTFEPADVRALVEATVKLMQPCAAERGVTLTTTFKGQCRPVELDGRALEQALVNLIDNAIKHSPPDAGVAIGVEFDSASPRQPSGNGVAPATLRVWVEDAGEGIPPEEQERIFERFYRRGPELRRATQGIGLGLAIVKYVTEAHGGKVSVRSAVGQGSRFTLELPCAAPPPAP